MPTSSSSIVDQCTPSQLKTLLGLAAGAPGEGAGLLAQAADPGRLAEVLAELCGSEAGAGDVLVETVCGPRAPLEALGGVKELAKKLLGEATTEAQRNAATVLYHGAVAAAFGRHGVNISTRPVEARLGLYEDLATALGPHPLGEVFREAVDRALKPGEVP
jgi:hypothetical protein